MLPSVADQSLIHPLLATQRPTSKTKLAGGIEPPSPACGAFPLSYASVHGNVLWAWAAASSARGPSCLLLGRLDCE
jgi:hypothetical protein